MKRLASGLRNRGLLQVGVGFGVLLCVVVYLWLRHDSLDQLHQALGFGTTSLHDFHAFFYPMGQQVLSGEYPIFIYSAMAALMFVPFGVLPYPLAAWIWFGVLLGAVFLLGREAVRPVRRSVPLTALGWFLVLASMPVLHDLKFGQVSLLIAVSMLLSVRAYERRQPNRAIFWLSFASAFKFYTAIFLAYFFFRKDWRFVIASSLLLLGFVVALPVLVLGVEPTIRYYQHIADEILSRFGEGNTDINSQSFESLAARALTARGVDAAEYAAVIKWARNGIVAGFLAVTAWLALSRGKGSARWAFLWLLVATPFLVNTSWPHYFVYLPVVTMSVLAWAFRESTLPVCRVVAAGLAVLGSAATNLLVFDAWDNRFTYVNMGVLFFGNLAAMFSLLIVFWVERQSTSSSSSPR